MKKSILLALACLMATLAMPLGSAFAQVKPEFKLGFAALAGRIPAIVGEPLENEHYGANGDSLQQTAKGLMVWRKADNWTAFTDGAKTWINGPYGLQERGNDRRFVWESRAAVASPPTATYSASSSTVQGVFAPEVKSTDEESAGLVGVVKGMMGELDTKWAKVWGWRPHKPVTVYLYFDGYRMADGLASLSGVPLTSTRREEVATTTAGLKTADRQTGGWALLLNLKRWFGSSLWDIRTKHLLTHEYTHVMQSDAAKGAGPTWFHEGMAELSAFVEVPEAIPYLDRTRYVSRARDSGELPSLRYLQTNWREMIQARGEKAQLAYGVSYLAVKYLANRVGGMPLLEVLQRTSTGQGFEAALESVTGYTLDRLDAEYREGIPPSQ